MKRKGKMKSGNIVVNIEVRQTLLSRFIVNLALLLDYCQLIRQDEAINLMDIGYYRIKSFKSRVDKGEWIYFAPRND